MALHHNVHPTTLQKLRSALGQKSGRIYGQHEPGDLLRGTMPSDSTLRRWETRGYIKRTGAGYALTRRGYEEAL